MEIDSIAIKSLAKAVLDDMKAEQEQTQREEEIKAELKNWRNHQ